ncbi:MAG TPA: metalloregulator ArsR/SmtB family transcription factor [Membranihabitans sp.]|nr:metalloregulator ArsR/SmtB family transcription factor [Membranihabitans sp.]
MGVTKFEKFTDEQNAVATVAKALGHPARVAIINHLLSVHHCICRDIVDVLPLSQPTIAQHLQVLHQNGVIVGDIQGNAICYRVNEYAIDILLHYLESVTTRLS